MTKQLKNYKLSCVGLDDDGQPSRMVFFVYSVETVEDAIDEARQDHYRRKVMGRQNLDWKSAELRAVRCNQKGEVDDSDIPQELEIMMLENAEIENLRAVQKARSWLT